MRRLVKNARLILFILPILGSCNIKNRRISIEDIDSMNLKEEKLFYAALPKNTLVL